MDQLRFGFAQEPFTPDPKTVFMDGYGFRLSPAQGAADDLYVKACAIEDGERRHVVVSFDLCAVRGEAGALLRAQIMAATGLGADEITLCATHTHAGPAVGVLGDLPVNLLVCAQIGDQAARAVESALRNCRPGRVTLAFGDELRSLFNRRGGKLCDKRVRTAAVVDEENRLMGVLCSASCHAVIRVGMELSADFPGVLTRRAQERYPGVVFLYLQGRDGDVDPWFGGEPFAVESEKKCEQLGGELSGSVFGALCGDRIDSGAHSLRRRREAVRVPMLPFPPEEALQQKISALFEGYRAEADAVAKRILLRDLRWHRMALERVRAGETENSLEVPVEALRLSDKLILIFLPFEPLTETGNAVEAVLRELGYPPEGIFVVGYANDTAGYLAPASIIGSDLYEAEMAAHWYGLPQCSSGSEPAVLAAVTRLAEDVSGDESGENGGRNR